MVSDRRRGGENALKRVALINAAEQLIREEGYPSVTAGNLSEKVGLSRQIVHYYFHSMDDVFIAVIRKNAENMRALLEDISSAAEPLRALQIMNKDPAQAILNIELSALANRRPAVRAEVVRAAEEARKVQTQILANHLKQRGIKPAMEPVVATVLLTSLAQSLALESAIDINSGHKETLKFVDLCLRAFAEGQDVPFPSSKSAMPAIKGSSKLSAPRKRPSK